MAKTRINDYEDGNPLPGANLEQDFDNFTTNTHQIVSPMDGNISGGSLYKLTNLANGSSAGDSVVFEQLGWNLIQAISASASASIEFSTGLTSLYDGYVVNMTNIQTSIDATTLTARVAINGVYQTGASDYAYVRSGGDTSTTTNPAWFGDNTESFMSLAPFMSGTANNPLCGQFKFWAPADNTNVKIFAWDLYYINSAGLFNMLHGGGFLRNGSAINRVLFQMSGGATILSGRMTLFGIRKT